jgi:hypothetical protein
MYYCNQTNSITRGKESFEFKIELLALKLVIHHDAVK